MSTIENMIPRSFFTPEWSVAVDQPVEGTHRYMLPLVKCPVCGNSRSAGGLWYPEIAGERLFDGRTLGRMCPNMTTKDVSWDEFKAYVQRFREVVSAEWPVAPGTSFGVFRGRVFSACPDFVVPLPEIMLARRDAIDKLKQEGFPFRVYEVELRSKKPHDLVEVWAPPVGLSTGAPLCPECERGGTSIYGAAVCADTIPAEAHLFRLKNNPNFVVFSSELMGVIQKLALTGLTFKQLATG